MNDSLDEAVSLIESLQGYLAAIKKNDLRRVPAYGKLNDHKRTVNTFVTLSLENLTKVLEEHDALILATSCEFDEKFHDENAY
jgi:hypothetical protein